MDLAHQIEQSGPLLLNYQMKTMMWLLLKLWRLFAAAQ